MINMGDDTKISNIILIHATDYNRGDYLVEKIVENSEDFGPNTCSLLFYILTGLRIIFLTLLITGAASSSLNTPETTT